MSATKNGNSGERTITAERANGWRDKDNTPERAEYEAETGGLGFAKDFHPALEALMMDRAATYGQRFLAWLKRYSWGNFRLYAAKENGEPKTQADCAQELGIDKRIVSQLTNYYEKRGYLYRKGKLLYPSISPKVTPICKKVRLGPDFLKFLEEWKVSSGSDFLELEVAQATVKRIELVRLGAYKQWRKARTNGGAYNNEESREREERESSSSSAVLTLPEEPEEETTTTTLPEPAEEPEPALTSNEAKKPEMPPCQPQADIPAESPVAVLTEVLTEALETHPIGGMPSQQQIADLVPLLPAGATDFADVAAEFGVFITGKLATRKMKTVGGLWEFTREFTRLYRPKKTSHSRGQPATKRVLRCPNCKSHWVTDEKCNSCGTPYSAFVT